MAVYASLDVVSDRVAKAQNWEGLQPLYYGKPGHAYDIGGNIGIYSLALAKAGWNVTTFEPMVGNLELINASLCANPEVVPQIDLRAVGLSDVERHCRMVSDRVNKGDGVVKCNGEDIAHQPGHEFVVRGEFDLKVLDDEMASLKFRSQPADFVKVDVEGFECHVWRGSRELLKQRPRLIQSEVWGAMQDCKPSDYLQLFRDAGYRISTDVTCRLEAPWSGPRRPEIADYWMCSTMARPKPLASAGSDRQLEVAERERSERERGAV